MALSKTTQDHDEIREWAEKRGGKPAEVASTEKNGETGILRIEFPGATNANDSNLKEISWDEFFEKFDRSGLALVYQEVTSEGAESNFNKLVHTENAKPAKSAGRKAPAKKSAGTKAPAKAASSKNAPAPKTPAKAAAAKQAPAKKSPAKKAPAEKTPAKKTPAKKLPAKKVAPKKTATKKATASTPAKTSAKGKSGSKR